MDKYEIRSRLELVVDQLQALHEQVVVEAARMGVRPIDLRLPTGEFRLQPIFIAQAHALAALAQMGDLPD